MERHVTKPQVERYFAWSEGGFKSPFAHQCDESRHGQQVSPATGRGFPSSRGQRTVKDQPVAFVVVDHGTAFVCVVVGAPCTMRPPLASTAFAAASTSAVLIPTTTCPCVGWSAAVASARVIAPPSRAAKWAPSRNFSGIPRVSL